MADGGANRMAQPPIMAGSGIPPGPLGSAMMRMASPEDPNSGGLDYDHRGNKRTLADFKPEVFFVGQIACGTKFNHSE